MTHGSLFSGIGGFDLAAEWMGWENKFHCEWNEFCQRVLKYYWPHAKSYGDIDNTDFTIWRGRIDVLSGGFPCQPYSTAGNRKGKEDVRHKWPQMLRSIREIQPSYVVGENVRGLTNWNGGMVFDEVQADLEAEGYEVLPFLLPACGVNAPHRRDRIWFIAHSNKNVKPISIQQWRQNEASYFNAGGESKNGFIANAIGLRQQGSRGSKYTSYKQENEAWKTGITFYDGRWATESPLCSGNDGLPGELDGITFPDFSKRSHEGYGNAIVPQVAFQIFNVIEEIVKWQKV